MNINRRAFIAIGALAVCGQCSGCSSMLLRDRHYMEKVSSILITEDEKKLVIMTKDYHYIFDAPHSIAITLRSKFHKNIFGEFGEFHINSSGEILGEYVLRLSKYTSQKEQHEALAAGYRRHIDGSMSIEGELKGQRYSSSTGNRKFVTYIQTGHFCKISGNNKMNNPYFDRRRKSKTE
jgi:hypothetical protein